MTMKYIASTLETPDRAIAEHYARDLGLVAHNIIPPSSRDDLIPKMTYFGEWSNDFADYEAIFEVEGPENVSLQNGKWHSGEGYILELLSLTPLAEDDDGRTYTHMQLRVLDTGREWDTREDDPIIDHRARDTRENDSILLSLYYYHEGE